MEKRWLTVALVLTISIVLAGALAMTLNNKQTSDQKGPVINYSYRIVNTFPHDTSAYTQGLIFSDGSLFESTGGHGSSSLRQVDLETGKVLQQYDLSSEYFGEGLALVRGSLVQLTWLNNIGFEYNKETFSVQRNFSFSGQGWGLAFDGTYLIMSNGSSNLAFIDPLTYNIVYEISVLDGNKHVTDINELEYINGEIYANIWHSEKIAIINPQTGQIKGWIDLTGIYQSNNYDLVLNGIAYDAQTDRLFVTGKNWPNLYEITIEPVY